MSRFIEDVVISSSIGGILGLVVGYSFRLIPDTYPNFALCATLNVMSCMVGVLAFEWGRRKLIIDQHPRMHKSVK